ncbi:MAG: hypothetical protein ASUL_02314 [Candidatus Aramenus sulfurataquae]|uniref:Uncharacterized protein n=2 Tax=Candidatus Aramenus sulfurataquae TaxID=1326980 RepID=W7KKD2_9CREN|nr:MAG: hypothetical protein ASUL_02314 [Candidatus Aramenus sulfurataquae]MCL7344182.1 hypothetical protein [Candidatus Aramenus sulfurataquae]
MSVDSLSRTSDVLGIKIGEATAHILAAASIVEAIEGETEEVKETVRRYVDAWIAEVVPIKYFPGLAELISSRLKRKLTEVFDEISEDELGETLEVVAEFKKGLDNGEILYNYDEVEVRIERVMRALGIDLNAFSHLLEVSYLNEKFSRLISIFTVTIGIASVWDKTWTAESQ